MLERDEGPDSHRADSKAQPGLTTARRPRYNVAYPRGMSKWAARSTLVTSILVHRTQVGTPLEHSPHDDRAGLRAQHQHLLTETVGRLEREFSKHFTTDTLEHYVQDSYEELASKAQVLAHVPAFVERFAVDRLRALAKTSHEPVAISPDVLFVCERNDAASQMAATLFNRATGGRAYARSAGRKPAGQMAEAAISAMHEIGIEMRGNFPKPVTPEIEAASDIIVTMDAHDDVVVLEGKHFEAWELPHPSSRRFRFLSGSARRDRWAGARSH